MVTIFPEETHLISLVWQAVFQELSWELVSELDATCLSSKRVKTLQHKPLAPVALYQ